MHEINWLIRVINPLLTGLWDRLEALSYCMVPDKTTQTVKPETEGDLVLREVWRAKDALSAARGHSIDKLFADLRKREKKSGHPVVNLQQKRKNRDAKERTTK